MTEVFMGVVRLGAILLTLSNCCRSNSTTFSMNVDMTSVMSKLRACYIIVL